MHDEPNTPPMIHPDDSRWADLFASLPAERPAPGVWAAMQTRLRARRQRRQRLRRWALAAGIGFLALLAIPLAQRPQIEMRATVDADADLKPLLLESARLEALLAATAGDSTQGAWIALSTDLQDRLEDIDTALADTPEPARQQALWRERVSVLRELAALAGTDRWRAVAGESGLDGALVVAW